MIAPRTRQAWWRLIVLPMLLATLTTAAGCAIQPDRSPRPIALEDQGDLDDAEPTGGAAEGSSLVFLLAPNEAGEPRLLRSVMRGVNPDISNVLLALLKGPNSAESGDSLTSAIPPDLELISAFPLGRRWVIDVNDALDQLDAVDLRNAVAQIVMTATAANTVDAVEIRVNGEDRSWPRGDGTLTDQPLTPYDFPGLVESTQPAYPALSSATP